jgi:hypothetical protein
MKSRPHFLYTLILLFPNIMLYTSPCAYLLRIRKFPGSNNGLHVGYFDKDFFVIFSSPSMQSRDGTSTNITSFLSNSLFIFRRFWRIISHLVTSVVRQIKHKIYLRPTPTKSKGVSNWPRGERESSIPGFFASSQPMENTHSHQTNIGILRHWWSGRSVKMTTQIRLKPRLRVPGAIPPRSLTPT